MDDRKHAVGSLRCCLASVFLKVGVNNTMQAFSMAQLGCYGGRAQLDSALAALPHLPHPGLQAKEDESQMRDAAQGDHVRSDPTHCCIRAFHAFLQY